MSNFTKPSSRIFNSRDWQASSFMTFDPESDAIVAEQMEGGIILAQHYLSEALRLVLALRQ